jgi:hypothetical protein
VTQLLALRTLPIHVPIADGESMHSWLEAIARRYRITVRELPRLGWNHVPICRSTIVWPSRYG